MSSGGISNSIGVLRQFIRRGPPVERCELCSAELAHQHPHLVEPQTRKLVCACNACAILFSGQGGSKYKRVPQRIRLLADLRLTDTQWASLMIPINMAFFFESSVQARVVTLYPSPAGATESQLSMEAWSEIVEQNPVLKDMEPDVEALLVNRLGPMRGYAAAEYYLLPIDECYGLVGMIRANWKGFSGGAEVWEKLERFFAGLRQRACARSGARHA